MRFLDIAADTCDVSLKIASRGRENIKISEMDFSLSMLRKGQEKVRSKKTEDKISLQYADAQKIPFKYLGSNLDRLLRN